MEKKLTRDNPTKSEREASNKLKNRIDIVVKPADKEGALVMMNSKDYLKEELNDTNSYQKLNKDPTEDHEKLINNTIDDLVSENAINEETASLLCPNKSSTLKFYMLLKLHKEDMLGHPVASSASSPTEKISAFVDEFLKQMAQNFPSCTEDTNHFLEKINQVGKVSNDTHMVTLDVKSLHTNIDNNEGPRVIEEEFEERATKNTPRFAVILLMNMVLILNNFVFNGVNISRRRLWQWDLELCQISLMCSWDTVKKNLFTKVDGSRGSLSLSGGI